MGGSANVMLIFLVLVVPNSVQDTLYTYVPASGLSTVYTRLLPILPLFSSNAMISAGPETFSSVHSAGMLLGRSLTLEVYPSGTLSPVRYMDSFRYSVSSKSS